MAEFHGTIHWTANNSRAVIRRRAIQAQKYRWLDMVRKHLEPKILNDAC